MKFTSLCYMSCICKKLKIKNIMQLLYETFFIAYDNL